MQTLNLLEDERSRSCLELGNALPIGCLDLIAQAVTIKADGPVQIGYEDGLNAYRKHVGLQFFVQRFCGLTPKVCGPEGAQQMEATNKAHENGEATDLVGVRLTEIFGNGLITLPELGGVALDV